MAPVPGTVAGAQMVSSLPVYIDFLKSLKSLTAKLQQMPMMRKQNEMFAIKLKNGLYPQISCYRRQNIEKYGK